MCRFGTLFIYTEEITCHQISELSRPLFQTHSTSKPKSKMLDVIQELSLSSSAEAELMLANHIKVNGGDANAGDVVSCTFKGEKVIGELLLSVVVHEAGAETRCSLISAWTKVAQTSPAWPSFSVSEDKVLKVPMDALTSVHTYSMAMDRTTCLVYDP